MRALIAIVFVALFGGGEAIAATCAALRAQLASAQSGGGSPKLRAQYDAYGCSGASAWGRHRACAGIERQMRGGGASARTIRALRSQVAAACAAETREASVRDAGPVVRTPAASNGTRMIGGRVVAAAPGDTGFGERRGGGFFNNIFGGRPRVVREDELLAARARTVERLDMEEARGQRRERNADDDPGRAAGDADIASVASGSGGKTLREGSTQTVCVRLCDGFYFPINDRSHSANFYEELAMCVGRCPGADVSLYEHPSGTPPEGMRSTLTNERYTDLPTAFEYRKGLTGGCGCHARSVIADGTLDAGRTLGYVGLARPSPTPAAPEAALAAQADGVSRRWSPLRAVFDETGRPLPPSLTARTVVDGRLREMSAGRPPVVAAAPAAGPPQPLPLTGPAPLRLREVGPQFFSATAGGAPAAVERRRITPALVTTTAVRVVPLAPGASVGAAAQEPAAPADTPAEPALDEAAALASDVDVSTLPANPGG